MIMVVAWLNMLDTPVEIRFSSTQYNYLFVMVLCVLLPLSIFLTSFTLNKRSNKYAGIGLSVFLVFPCSLVYYFSSDSFEDIDRNGVDISFEKINEIKAGGSSYCLYRTNGGATTSFGLVLRKETSVVGGGKYC